MLSINEQTELEVLQSIEEPTPLQQTRIEYLLSKKEEPESEPKKEEVSSSDGCGCIHCWMKKIPEDSEPDKIVEHSLIYFKNRAKKDTFHNSKVQSMYREFMDRIPENLMTTNTRLEDILDYFCPPELDNQALIDSYKTDIRVSCAVWEAAADFQANMTNLFLDNPCRDLFFVETIYIGHLEIFKKLDQLCEKHSIEPTWQLVRVLSASLVFYVKQTMRLVNKLSEQLKHKSTEDQLKEIISKIL